MLIMSTKHSFVGGKGPMGLCFETQGRIRRRLEHNTENRAVFFHIQETQELRTEYQSVCQTALWYTTPNMINTAPLKNNL